MAGYKAILDGEIQMYTDIENKVMDLAACKGRAFDDSSMEESERELLEMLEEERQERRAGEND